MKIEVKKIMGKFVIDSRYIATITGISHFVLAKEINKLISMGKNTNDCFILMNKEEHGSTYYVTREGCDLLSANNVWEKNCIFDMTYRIIYKKAEDQNKERTDTYFVGGDYGRLEDMVYDYDLGYSETYDDSIYDDYDYDFEDEYLDDGKVPDYHLLSIGLLMFDIKEEKLSQGINGLEWLVLSIGDIDNLDIEEMNYYFRFANKNNVDPIQLIKDAFLMNINDFIKKYEKYEDDDFCWEIWVNVGLVYLADLMKHNYDKYFDFVNNLYK